MPLLRNCRRIKHIKTISLRSLDLNSLLDINDNHEIGPLIVI